MPKSESQVRDNRQKLRIAGIKPTPLLGQLREDEVTPDESFKKWWKGLPDDEQVDYYFAKRAYLAATKAANALSFDKIMQAKKSGFDEGLEEGKRAAAQRCVEICMVWDEPNDPNSDAVNCAKAIEREFNL